MTLSEFWKLQAGEFKPQRINIYMLVCYYGLWNSRWADWWTQVCPGRQPFPFLLCHCCFARMRVHRSQRASPSLLSRGGCLCVGWKGLGTAVCGAGIAEVSVCGNCPAASQCYIQTSACFGRRKENVKGKGNQWYEWIATALEENWICPPSDQEKKKNDGSTVLWEQVSQAIQTAMQRRLPVLCTTVAWAKSWN